MLSTSLKILLYQTCFLLMGTHVLAPGDPAFAEFLQNQISLFLQLVMEFANIQALFTCANSFASGSMAHVFADAFCHPVLHPFLSSTEAYHE
jgi:hypothetical protein